MTRTKHGHHISGTTYDDEKFLITPQPCGGASVCIECAKDCGTIKVLKDGHILLDIDNPAEAHTHLVFLLSVVRHSYGAVDGEIEIEFLEKLIKQIEAETTA